MNFLWLGLICTIIKVSGQPGCTPQFTCFPDNPQAYQVYGINLTCPAGFTCNAGYDMTSCDPCIVPTKDVCGFQCNGPAGGELILEMMPKLLRPFTCPSGYLCNEAFESCLPCIVQKCPTFWTCNPANPRVVSVLGITLQCDAGLICNANYVQPCDMCITDTAPLPTPPPTVPILPIGVQYPPNCNDGMGATYPCRPGPPRPLGSRFYYKCIPVGMVFDFIPKLCTELATDTCRNAQNLCRY